MRRSRLISCIVAIGLVISSFTSNIGLTNMVVNAADETYIMPTGAYSEEKEIEVKISEGLDSSRSSETFSGSYYDQLDDDSKTVYDVLLEAYKDSGTTDTIEITEVCKTWEDVDFYKEGSLITGFVDDNIRTEFLEWAEEVVSPAYLALEYDHPELAWISGVGFSIGFNVISFSFTDNGDGTYRGDIPVYVTGSLISLATDVDSDYVSDLVTEAMTHISGDTDLKIIKSIYDYLIATAEYTSNSVTDKYYQSSVAALTGEAVCTGYARAFKLLCDQYDIPCICVNGLGGYISHAWNYVEINDNWYAIDVTWADAYESDEWYLVGSDTFFEDHTEEGAWDSLEIYEFVYPVLSSSTYQCNHKYESIEAVVGSCIQGNRTTYECTLCGDIYEIVDEIDSSAHVTVQVTYEGNCEEGLTETHTCLDCGTVVTVITLDPQEHTYENGVCSTCGYECDHEYSSDGVCSKCGNDLGAAIVSYSLSDCDIELEYEGCAYSGKENTPSVTVTYDGVVIDESCYEVTYSNNVEVGTATVDIKSNKNVYYITSDSCYYLSDSTSTTFEIGETYIGTAASAVSLSYCDVIIDSNTYCYTGSAIEPIVTVKYGNSTVNEVCYTVTYSNNVNTGTATITVEESGENYIVGNAEYSAVGSKSITFSIVNHNYVEGVCSNCGATMTTTGGVSSDSNTGKTNESNSSTSGEGNSTNSGTTEGADSGIGSAVWTLNLAACDISLSKTSYTYTGKKIKPTVTVSYDNQVISSDYYEVTYSKNKNVGTATVTVTGKMVDGSGCKGTLKTTFTIKKAKHKNVKIAVGSTYKLGCKATSTKSKVAKAVGAKIKAKNVGVTKIKSKNYKTFKVTVIPKKTKVQETWNNDGNVAVTLKKVSNATGYEVQLSTSKKFTSSRVQRVRGQKLTIVFTNLTNSKVYYVRARSYVIKNGKKYYSKWSVVKKAYPVNI